MTLLIKTFAAFCLGAAALAGLQTAGMLSLQRSLKAQPASAMPVGPGIDFAAIKARGPIGPQFGPIDTREGERLGVESAARRAEMQIRAAQNAVPLQPRQFLGRRR